MKWETEVQLRREEIEHDSPNTNSDSASSLSTSDHKEQIRPDGGYVIVDVPDEYKSLFCDTINGFEEYARLKGYQVSMAIDGSLPGKVGFKFTILDQGVTVSTNTVRSDVDEYIAQFKESETFEHLPIVIDPVEHERLKTALAARFIMIRNNAEMYRLAADFYKDFAIRISRAQSGGVGYLPSPATIINNQIEHGDLQLAGKSYSVDHSPGAAVGKESTSWIDGSVIAVGSTVSQKTKQIESLDELIQLLTDSGLRGKSDAVRHLRSAKEELSAGEPPNSGVIGQCLNAAKDILTFAEEGSGIWKKAREVLGSFNVSL